MARNGAINAAFPVRGMLAVGTATVTIAPMVQKPRILLVEDEPGIADTLQYVLATDGLASLRLGVAVEGPRQSGRCRRCACVRRDGQAERCRWWRDERGLRRDRLSHHGRWVEWHRLRIRGGNEDRCRSDRCWRLVLGHVCGLDRGRRA